MAESRGTVPERVRRALYTLSRGRCYAPDCDEPVILIDGGEPVFVGEIAHIIGAVESGPRGRLDIADRDTFENLLILCGRHHKIVDNPRARDRYPVEVLREWKARHEADFDTAALAELRRLNDLPTRLPHLLIEVFRDATADLEVTVDKLEAAGHLAHDTAQLLHAALTRTGGISGSGMGDGVPGIKEAFEEAYDAAGGASFLGLPSADAYELGPGFVQHLRGARCGHPAVICAIRNRAAVVVTADLWNAISTIGDGALDGGVQGAGFPLSSSGGHHRYIGPAVGQVPTTGGSWGGGSMIRDADSRWKWIADLAFDPNCGGDADTAIDTQARLDLRLRLAARMPFIRDELRVTAAGRRRLTAELAKPEMTAIMATLAGDRISLPPDQRWRPREDQFARNDSWGASYDCVINTVDDRPAIRGSLQYLMPNLTMSCATSLVDVQFDFDGCQTQPCPPNTPVSRRVSLMEIVDFFTWAWTTAFDILPLALGQPTRDVEPGGRPRVSLYIINERSPNTGGERIFTIGDLVDLSPFGTTHKTHLSRLDIAVLGRGSLPEHETRDVVRKALVRVGENAGFDAADLMKW